jgi:hypothetical protein
MVSMAGVLDDSRPNGGHAGGRHDAVARRQPEHQRRACPQSRSHHVGAICGERSREHEPQVQHLATDDHELVVRPRRSGQRRSCLRPSHIGWLWRCHRTGGITALAHDANASGWTAWLSVSARPLLRACGLGRPPDGSETTYAVRVRDDRIVRKVAEQYKIRLDL